MDFDYRVGNIQKAGIDPGTGAQMYNSFLEVTLPDGTVSAYKTGNFRNKSDVSDDLNKMLVNIQSTLFEPPQVDQMKVTGFAGMGPIVTEQVDNPEFGGSTFGTTINSGNFTGTASEDLLNQLVQGGNLTPSEQIMSVPPPPPVVSSPPPVVRTQVTSPDVGSPLPVQAEASQNLYQGGESSYGYVPTPLKPRNIGIGSLRPRYAVSS